MEMTYQLTIQTNTNHSFTHFVNGAYLKVHILYDGYTDSYYMNIDRQENGVYKNIVNSIKLVIGVNILEQYSYLNLGDMFLIPATDRLFRDEPNASTINTGYFILWSHS